jgi:hypothetical protein
MEKKSGPANAPLPQIKSDLMQMAIRYRMPYYEVSQIYAQVKEYVETQHPDFADGVRLSYIMKLTELNTRKVAVAKGRFEAPKPSRSEDE